MNYHGVMRRKQKAVFRIIAKSRVNRLFSLAGEVASADLRLADLYVGRALKVAQKFNIQLTSAQKRLYCKHCHSFMLPSVSARIRLQHGKVVYFCKRCRHMMRIPYIKPRTEN